ncbi:MAG: hypothetical protein QOF20_2578 [Acidimicrobiaceae bacterium]|nr:hypothetical protein [Acidimicrobiaceae bacterium]MDQ1400151.1 hypothetical protein [Acidimicrobiaceae bacterium]MDQ1413747.1 hypothetical protein [Acidimicrobiaceae bacterium]MDQ1414763.1 hypothetical protein [Acidimicrobiaceae bacterium]
MPHNRYLAAPRWIPLAVALAVLAAACGGAKKVAKPGAATTVPPSSAATTSTTAAPPPVSPLTGMAQPDGGKLARVSLAVKIDNVDDARPQAGLDAADVVYEEMVEGRVTRLLAIFQSSDTARIGPVRSTRTTDINVVSSLNHPLYSYSGGNTGFVAQLRAAPVVDVGADAHGEAYVRSGPHAAPHNLYTSTAGLLGLAPKGSGPPPAMFAYRAAGQTAVGAGVAPASHLDLNFGFSSASWDWDAASQTWKRGQNGSADVLQSGQQIAASNVIVQIVAYTTDGYASGEGISPPPAIPKGQTVGSGTAIVMTGGAVIRANWTKAAPTSVTQFTDSGGQPIQLTAGRTWVELAPEGTTLNVH